MAEFNFRIIDAPEGKWITQVAEVEPSNRVFSKKVYLGIVDSPDNWHLVDDAYKEAFEEALKEATEQAE